MALLIGVCVGWWLGVATVFGVTAWAYRRGVRGL
jgi:hypothetical protein